jgi:hypothetical protein
MTNDASQGRPPSGTRDWESTALQRVAAHHVELQDVSSENAQPTTPDWERRAVETLRRYFRAQR